VEKKRQKEEKNQSLKNQEREREREREQAEARKRRYRKEIIILSLFFSEITNHPFSLKHSVIRSLYFILVCNSVFIFIFFDNVVVSFLHCPQTYNQNFMLQLSPTIDKIKKSFIKGNMGNLKKKSKSTLPTELACKFQK
jgi:hypothetical protein